MINITCPNPSCGNILIVPNPNQGEYWCPRCLALLNATPRADDDEQQGHVTDGTVVRHALIILALLGVANLLLGSVFFFLLLKAFEVPPPTCDMHALVWNPTEKTITGTIQSVSRVIKTSKVTWDARTGREIATEEVRSVYERISPDRKWALTKSPNNQCEVSDFSSGKRLFTLPTGDGSSSCAFSADSKWLACRLNQGKDQFVEVRELPSGNRTAMIKGGGSYRFSPSSNRIALDAYDGRNYHVTLWDTTNGELVATLLDPKHHICFSAFSRDSELVATKYFELKAAGELQVWDAETGLKSEEFTLPVAKIDHAIFTADGALLVSEPIVRDGPSDPYDKTRWWNVRKKQPLFEARLSFSQFLNDGGLICGMDTSDFAFKVWDAKTGRLISTLDGRPERSIPSPDGTRMASHSHDRNDRSKIDVVVWDIATGKKDLQFAASRSSIVSPMQTLFIGSLAAALVSGLCCLWRSRPGT